MKKVDALSRGFYLLGGGGGGQLDLRTDSQSLCTFVAAVGHHLAARFACTSNLIISFRFRLSSFAPSFCQLSFSIPLYQHHKCTLHSFLPPRSASLVYYFRTFRCQHTQFTLSFWNALHVEASLCSRYPFHSSTQNGGWFKLVHSLC